MADNPFAEDTDDDGVAVGDYSPTGDQSWQEIMFETMQPLVVAAAKKAGINPTLAKTFVNQNFSGLMSYLNRDIMTTPQAHKFYTTTGMTSLVNVAYNWFAQKIPGLRGTSAFGDHDGGGGGGGGGGRGGGGPTAADIRASFDLNQLSDEVTKMTRGFLLTEPKDPRGIARAYVDAVVANPAQELDFQTFVKDRLRADPRWTTLYKLKPKAMDELDYIGQYTQHAQRMLGANSGVDWSEQAFHAAGLGADPQAWNERLERSDRFTAQAPFVSKLQQRVSGLRHVLRA